MKFISQYKGLPKQVYILSIARIITAMGAFIYAFNSLLLTSVLGLSQVAAGYMMIATAVFGMAGALSCGKLADKLGRKKVLVALLSVEITALLIGGFVVYSLAALPCLVVVSFCFSGALPIFAAMITDLTDAENRKESFSLMFLCINIGYALGQVFAGMLFYNFTRWIFWGQGVCFLTATLIILFFVKDTYGSDEKIQQIESNTPNGEKESPDFGVSSFIKIIFKDKLLICFLFAIILVMFSHIQVSYMLPLQFTHFFGVESSSHLISYVWIINGTFCVIWTPFLLKVTKHNSQIVNLAIAGALYFIGFGMYGLVKTYGGIWIGFLSTIIWTAGEVLVSTGSGVFIASRAPKEFRARYQSLYEFSSGVGRCIGPVTMGYFLTGHSYGQGWMMAAIICMIAVIILLTAKKISKEL